MIQSNHRFDTRCDYSQRFKSMTPCGVLFSERGASSTFGKPTSTGRTPCGVALLNRGEVMCNRCNGMTVIVSSKDGSRGMAFSPDCKTWKCPECGVNLRDKWLARANETFAESPLWEVAVCSDAEFQALARRIRRSGIYYRVRIGRESYVFHTPLVMTRQHKPDESKWLGSEATARAFAKVLAMPGVSRVSCSRGLQQKTPDEPPTRWKREAVKRKSIGEFNHLLTRLAIDARIEPLRSFSRSIMDVILLRDLPSSCPRLSIPASCSERNTRTTRLTLALNGGQ